MEKDWKDMTPEERKARILAGKAKAKAKREALAARREKRQAAKDEELLQTPLAALLPDEADEVADAAGDSVVSTSDEATERRRRLLADVDPETAELFTDEELAAIEAAEEKKANDERKSLARKDIAARAKMLAQVKNLTLPPSVLRDDDLARYLNEEVTDRLDLPPGSMPPGKEGISVNGFMYQNGRTYTRPRHVWQSLWRTQYDLTLRELMFELNNQDKPGRSAREVLHRTVGQRHAA